MSGGNVLYFGGDDGNVYAVDAETGKEKWRFNNELSWVITSPAAAQGKVFFATSDSSLYHVLDAATGKSLVRQKDKGYMFSSPTVAGDVVLIGVLNGTLVARDIKTGTRCGNTRPRLRNRTKGGSHGRSKIQRTV